MLFLFFVSGAANVANVANVDGVRVLQALVQYGSVTWQYIKAAGGFRWGFDLSSEYWQVL